MGHVALGGHALTEEDDVIADDVVLEDTTELVIVDEDAELVIELEMLLVDRVDDAELDELDDEDMLDDAELDELNDEDMLDDAELDELDDDDMLDDAELDMLDEDRTDEDKVDDPTELVNDEEAEELDFVLETEDSVDEDILLLVRLNVVMSFSDDVLELLARLDGLAEVEKLPHGALLGLGQLP